jgi:hypothetical protein
VCVCVCVCVSHPSPSACSFLRTIGMEKGAQVEKKEKDIKKHLKETRRNE